MEENKFYIDNETLIKELDTEDEYFKEYSYKNSINGGKII